MRYVILSVLLSLLLIPPVAFAKHPVQPPYLREGDTVGIIAPSGRLRADADTAQVRARFAEWGLQVRFGQHLLDQSHPHFAGTDSLRAADLQAMIDDPSIKAIVAYKGGYGAVHLLPLVQMNALRRNPKWVVGFSDITMLHMALGREGVESIHGTMPSKFQFHADTVDSSAMTLRRALFGQAEAIRTEPHPLNCAGEATGMVAGGNLTLILSAIGTREQIDLEQGTILLIEDVGEAVYRLDRMMQQLLRSGMLNQVKGVIVGHFTDMKDVDRFGEPYAVIDTYLRGLDIPVVYAFPAGHEEPNTALYMGRQATLTVGQEGARLEYR